MASIWDCWAIFSILSLAVSVESVTRHVRHRLTGPVKANRGRTVAATKGFSGQLVGRTVEVPAGVKLPGQCGADSGRPQQQAFWPGRESRLAIQADRTGVGPASVRRWVRHTSPKPQTRQCWVRQDPDGPNGDLRALLLELPTYYQIIVSTVVMACNNIQLCQWYHSYDSIRVISISNFDIIKQTMTSLS